MQVSPRTLLKPVREGDTPSLTAYLHRSRQVGIRTGASVILLTILSTVAIGLLTQSLELGRLLQMSLPVLALSGLLNLIHTRLPLRLRRFNHEAHSMLALLYASSYGWVLPEVHWFQFPQLSYFVLFGVLIFSPLPPLYFIRMSVLNGLGQWSWYLWMAPVSEPGRALAQFPLMMGSTMALVVATQMMRHFWLHMEKSRQQLIAVDRLSTLGQHTAGIAHELNTPLSGALHANQGSHELLEELRESLGHPQVTQDDLREIVEELHLYNKQVASQLERSTRFVRALRESTQQMGQHKTTTFRLKEVVDSTLLLLSYERKQSGVAIHLGALPDCTLQGDPEKMSQVVGHLVANALEHHHKEGPDRWVHLEIRPSPARLDLIIEDNGPGVPEQLREQIFEPLFTTHQDHQGTGLGLSISRDIIQGVFGGDLRLEPTPSGARFVISLPRAMVRASPAQAPQRSYTPFGEAQSRASTSAQPSASSGL